MTGEGAAALSLTVLIAAPPVAAVCGFIAPRLAAGIAAVNASLTLIAAVKLLLTIGPGTARLALAGWEPPLGIAVQADALSAIMMLTVSIVLLATAAYGPPYFARETGGNYFWPLTLLLHASLNALFVAADVFNLYVALELASLSAVALVALADRHAAIAASLKYLLASMAASLAYLLGVALLYHATGVLDLALLAAAPPRGAPAGVALGLMTAGLVIKGALFPVHFWLPAAHAEAPTPVSALLSGLVVKAPFFVLLRLWLGPFAAAPVAVRDLLGALAAAAIVWGSLQALRQERLKLSVAYSTVAQIGLLYLVFPLLPAGTAVQAIVLLAISHALAKSAMFLAAGNVHCCLGHDRIHDLHGVARHLPITIAAFAVAGVCVAGLPPSGNFMAKWLLVVTAFEQGAWWWALLIVIGGLLSAAYVLRVIGHSLSIDDACAVGRPLGAAMTFLPFILAMLALLSGLAAAPLLAVLDVPVAAHGPQVGTAR